MQAFRYKGLDTKGQKVQGELTATSIDDAERRIINDNVTVISIVPAGMAKRRGGQEGAPQRRPLLGRSRATEADAAAVLRDLAVMAEAGVPFVEALDAVVSSARTPQIEKSLRVLKDEVVAGKSVAVGMRSAGKLFPPIVTEMMRVAEEGGRLDKSLYTAAGYLERAADLKKRVMNAMLYPIVLTVISALTLGVLIIFVLPKFGNLFSRMGADIPITTELMLALGTSIREHPFYVLGAVIISVVLLRVIFTSRFTSQAAARGVLRVPIVGELVKKLALSRAFQSISTLLGSNVPLISALEHGSKVAGNPVIGEALMYSRSSVEHGGAFSDSLAETGVFPKTVVQMVAVGERTGRLPQLMSTTASHMEGDVDARLKALVSIVEPVMIVFMGAIVGMITLSVIVPIYSVIENIK